MANHEKVSNFALLLMLQGSFPASQLVGTMQPFEVVPFQLDSNALRLMVPHLFGVGDDDRWAFCQAFANRPAQLVAFVTDMSSEHLVRLLVGGESTENLFGDALQHRLRDEIVVPVDVSDQSKCDHVLHIIADNAFLPGVSSHVLVHKVDIIREHLTLLRTQASAYASPAVA